MSEGSSASARVEAAAEALRKSISNGGLTTLLPNPVLGGLLAALPDTPSGESRGETVAAYREALQEIATRPTVERNPDGDDQATETMQLLARETLAAHGELRPAMPNMPEAESRVRKPAHTEQQGEEEARGEADDEAFMEAWGSLKTYTLHAYSERYSPSIRHDGPNVRTYDADAVDALLVRLRPAFQEASDTPEVVERPETCPTCGSDDPRIRYEECDDGSWEPPGPFANVNPCLDPFHTPGDTEEAPSRVEEDDPLTEGQRLFAGLLRVSTDGGIAALRYYEHWKKREEARAPASPQPVASEEDREVIRHLLRDGGNGVPLTAAGPLIRILTDSEALAQYAKERGE